LPLRVSPSLIVFFVVIQDYLADIILKWKNQWGFLVDFSYVKLGGDQESGGPTIHVDFEDLMTEAAGYYRFSKGPHAGDALFGVRYTLLSPTIGVGNLPSQTSRQDWVDPIIGARYIWLFVINGNST
jgi:hypothetical protein